MALLKDPFAELGYKDNKKIVIKEQLTSDNLYNYDYLISDQQKLNSN